MQIRWVNHASFVIEGEDFKLLVDPWLSGTAFNNGWSLMTPTQIEDSYWSEITHIWFSHEHPDHFSPPSLSSIKDKLNSDVTLFYQETKDKRVVAYCKAKGYNVIEAKNLQKYPIGKSSEIMVGQVPFYDSWLHVRSKDFSLLNLNDCVIKNQRQVASIKAVCGPVDMLFSQFGYANWEGNPEDVQRQKNSAAEKLRRLKIVENIIQPKYIFPFASYVIFSHKENFYLNAQNNNVAVTVDYIRKNCKAEPVVLKSNETWRPGSTNPTEANVQYYEEKRKSWVPSEAPDKKFTVEQLLEIIAKYNQKVLQKNNRLLINLCATLGFFKPLEFFVDDLGVVIRFSYLTKTTVSNEPYIPEKHIKLSSDSLAFLFSNEYGFDTLSVNGRFRASEDVEKQMFRTLAVGALNNMGLSFSFALPFRWEIVSRAISKFA